MNAIKIILKEKDILIFILCELIMTGFAPLFWMSKAKTVNVILLAVLIIVGSYSLYLLYKITKKFDQQSKENAEKEIILKQKEIQNQHIVATMQMSKDLGELELKLQKELYNQDITSTKQIDEYIKTHYESLFMFYSKKEQMKMASWSHFIQLQKFNLSLSHL